MFLGEVIRNYRLENHLTLADFSSRSGLSIPYVSQLEHNRNPKTNEEIVPSWNTFSKVASAMGIDMDDLLQLVDENLPDGLPFKKHGEFDAFYFFEGEAAELAHDLVSRPDLRDLVIAARKLPPESVDHFTALINGITGGVQNDEH